MTGLLLSTYITLQMFRKGAFIFPLISTLCQKLNLTKILFLLGLAAQYISKQDGWIYGIVLLSWWIMEFYENAHQAYL